jgi:hypothetical protein
LSLADCGGLDGAIPPASPFTPKPVVFTLYSRRWYVLFLFSTMALFNNAICYTVGSVYRISRRYYYVRRATKQLERHLRECMRTLLAAAAREQQTGR